MENQYKGGKRMDIKTNVIVILSVVVLILIGLISINAYNNQKVGVYNQGIQDGALLQQRNILQSVQATGYFTMNLVDAEGQPVSVVLAPVQPQQTGQ